MIRMIGAFLMLSLGVLFAGAAAEAAEIKVVAVGALQTALRNFGADYQAKTGNSVAYTFTNPALLNKTLADGSFDVIIAADEPVGRLETQGALAPDTRRKLVRTGIGVVIREGAAKPDLSTPEAFRRAVLAANSILYTDPATPNGSGIVTQAILSQANLLEVVRAKGQMKSLGEGKELIAKGEAEMGLFNVSEAKAPGVVVAGPVPAPLQHYTNYDVAIMKGAASAPEARTFLDFLSAPALDAAWKNGGLERPAAP